MRAYRRDQAWSVLLNDDDNPFIVRELQVHEGFICYWTKDLVSSHEIIPMHRVHSITNLV